MITSVSSRFEAFKKAAPGVARQLALEAIAPALTAAAWTAATFPRGAALAQLAQTFIPAFAVSMYLWAQIFRVVKQQEQRRGMGSIQERVEEAIRKLESSTEALTLASLGTDSMPEIYFNLAVPAGEPDSVAVMIRNPTDHPLYELRMDVSRSDPGGAFEPLSFQHPGTLLPKVMYLAGTFRLLDQERAMVVVGLTTRRIGEFRSYVLLRQGSRVWRATYKGQGEFDVPEGFPGYDPADPASLFPR